MKLFVATIALILFSLGVPQQVFGQYDAIEPGAIYIPGTVEGTGTYFEVTDSEYLNITLESTRPVKLRLESIPQMVVMDIEAAEGATSTQITLGGFPPSTTFYKYEDDYHNGVAMTTDANGNFTYVQDLSQRHHVFIQPNPSTRYIPQDTEIGTWDEVNRVYTLIQDVSESIQICEANLTLDGNGHVVTGTGTGIGIYVPNRSYCAYLTDVTLKNFSYGLQLNSDGNTLADITAAENYAGIWLCGNTNGNTLTGNAILDNQHGITVFRSNGNTLTDNAVVDNQDTGLRIDSSTANVLRGNTVSGSRINFDFGGYVDADFDHDIDTTNTVDGKPIFYVTNVVGMTYDASTNAGTFFAVNCNNITVRDLVLMNNRYGVFLWRTSNSTIENITVHNSYHGISMSYSGGSTLRNNTVLGYSYRGIWVEDSPGSTLTSNAASYCGTGIGVSRSQATNLTQNIANSSYGGYPATYGIYVSACPDSILTGNTANSNSGLGILLASCDRSILEDNTANSNASWGIRVASNHCRLTANSTDSNLGGGIALMHSTDCSLTGNSADLNSGSCSDFPAGIYLEICSGCALTRNTANSNQNGGIYLLGCSNSTLTQNSASNNWYGILLSWGAGNTITGNLTHFNSRYGIAVDSSSNNILAGNTSCHNEGYGISVSGDNNQIHSNIFIGNGTQARVWSGTGNVFNLDPPTGGNYWSDWTGPDDNGDGFVDSPYVFEGGQDNYPLADNDSDGVADNVEDGAPNDGDGNNDGIPDSQQDNVASLPNAEDGQYVTLASPDGTRLADVIAFGNPSPGDAPPGVDFPIGFLSFSVLGLSPGGSVDVTLFPPAGEMIATYYKYGPTKNNPEDHWYEFIFEGQTGAEIFADKVILHFIDGDEGDDDLQANGEVVEPGAPAFARYTRLAFLPPLGPDNKRLFKRGSTIPVKFRIADEEGNPVPNALATLAVYYLEDGAPDGQADVVSTAAGDWGDQFRYDPKDDLYIFNLSTKDPSYLDHFTYRIVATLDGGQTLQVDFSLK